MPMFEDALDFGSDEEGLSRSPGRNGETRAPGPCWSQGRDDFGKAEPTAAVAAAASTAAAAGTAPVRRLASLAGSEMSPQTRPGRDATVTVSDRSELIERLKRGESPTWVPSRHVGAFGGVDCYSLAGSLLPAATVAPEQADGEDEKAEAVGRRQEGMDMERPRSALHSGDFTESRHGREPSDRSRADGNREEGREESGEAVGRGGRREQRDGLDRAARFSPPCDSNAWQGLSPPRDYIPFSLERPGPSCALAETGLFRTSFSASSSASLSFVYRSPTSPLVQSESNTDDGAMVQSESNMDDGAMEGGLDAQRSNARRHTLSLATPSRPQQLFSSGSPSRPQQLFSCGSPSRPQRLFSSGSPSPLQHASMVGSYEESILRGRMSTTPSRPLDFLAQIGVLGWGPQCKPSLRCPSHVTLPFAAVFYSYSSGAPGRCKDEDGPSPYVGLVDLENGLPRAEAEQRSRRKLANSRAAASSARAQPGRAAEDVAREEAQAEGRDVNRAAKRRLTTCKAPPGGSYRIPQQGQLQIIIKNQNKTAVKLFLIPYDLADMEAGTKTFVRQRSYSAGPAMDHVPTASSGALAERPTLRYLVHLHICCPARGRYYLYKSIRVVFANRVPDGKEKLRNELTFPEPRFSPYKPIRVMVPTPLGRGSGPETLLAADKACRRRSSGCSRAGERTGTDLGEADGPLLYSKLKRGDVGYGGPATAEGLLSQRLRSLEVQKGRHEEA